MLILEIMRTPKAAKASPFASRPCSRYQKEKGIRDNPRRVQTADEYKEGVKLCGDTDVVS